MKRIVIHMNLPSSIIKNPLISSWIDFKLDGEIVIRTGKVELGQGISTALMQIAADELRVDIEKILLVSGSTTNSPDEGWTSASISIEVGGKSIQIVCSHVRRLFIKQAAKHFNTSPSEINVAKGQFFTSNEIERTDYYKLSRFVNLDQEIIKDTPEPQAMYSRYVGSSVPRTDIPRKISGAAFIQDFSLPEMLHARVLRGPNYHSELLNIDEAAIKSLPGVQFFVRNGRFLAICGEDEASLVKSASHAANHITWSKGQVHKLKDINRCLRSGTSKPETVYRKSTVNVLSAAREFRATYTKPFLAHASIGTVCAVASVEGSLINVWTQSQGVYPLRRSIAKFFSMPEEQVHLTHLDGAGCYGHNGADDAALDACIIASAVQRPIRVVWSRHDELAVSPLGSAMAVDISAAVDKTGRIISWHSEIFSFGHLIRPGWGETVNLLASTEIENPFPTPNIVDPPMTPFGGGATRNAIPLYNFPEQSVTLNLVEDTPVRTSALRGLGAYANVFAIESFIEEIAQVVGVDAIEYRLSHLTDSRARRVVQAIANSSISDIDENLSYGFGFAQYKNSGAYFAIKVEIDLSEGIRVNRVWAAVDAGLVINPDGVKNQIEGGIIQAISWTLKEEFQFTDDGDFRYSWGNYRILKFGEAPKEIHIRIIGGSENASLGVGECAAGPTAAAINNAISNALGIRVRHLPISYERLAEQLA